MICCLLGNRDYTKESGRYRATMGNDKHCSCNLYRRREMIGWFSLQTVTSITVNSQCGQEREQDELPSRNSKVLNGPVLVELSCR